MHSHVELGHRLHLYYQASPAAEEQISRWLKWSFMIDDSWHAGNAADESGQYRGWLLGYFIDAAPDSVRKTEALEIKWGIHPAGQSRDAWTTDEKRSTMVIMVDGRFRIDLSTGSVTLKRQGDYLVWGPGIDHSWEAEEDSTVITARWPSIP